jgi:hypothetical protein
MSRKALPASWDHAVPDSEISASIVRPAERLALPTIAAAVRTSGIALIVRIIRSTPSAIFLKASI